jgi:hypothetical protein
MRTRALAAAIACIAIVLSPACREKAPPPEAPKPLRIVTEEIGEIAGVGVDSLSDSAVVTAVIPEPDGETVALVFADPAKGVTAALAILTRGRDTAQLVWPDSVRAAWWSAEHRLAFQSASGAQGVHAVVDVHARELEHLEGAHDSIPPAPRDSAWPNAARARAVAYIDSLRLQPEGEPSTGNLRYEVVHALPSPEAADSVVAFYVAARGPGAGAATGRVNPAWYILDGRTRAVVPVDSLTGDARGMPERGAGWGASDLFVYARGGAIRAARLRR